MFRAMTCLARRDWARVACWAAVSLALHLVWEIAQLPLYVIAASGSAYELAYAVVHCTLGDVFIAGGAFILAMFLLGDSAWPAMRPWKGGAIAISFGLVYTAYSEWFNVYQVGNWAYADSMPLVFGLGVSPLVQWLVVPAVSLVAWRRLAGRIQATGLAPGLEQSISIIQRRQP